MTAVFNLSAPLTKGIILFQKANKNSWQTCTLAPYLVASQPPPSPDVNYTHLLPYTTTPSPPVILPTSACAVYSMDVYSTIPTITELKTD